MARVLRAIRTLLEDNLFLTAPQMGIIMKLWDEIREKYMVNLPQDDREAQSLDWRPQTNRDVSRESAGAIDDIRDYIIDEWLPEIVNVFNEADRNGMFVNVPQETIIRFFNSVSTLISNNFRSLVLESLKHFVNFLSAFQLIEKGPRPL